MRDRLGEIVGGRYLIEGKIGAGGVGSVYRARQLSLDRPVAIKMLHPSLSLSEGARRRFKDEARALALLNHPHIATVHDFGTSEEGEQFLVLEFVEGQPLAQIADRQVMPFAILRQIFEQTLKALTHAHEREIVHRDVKPANILVDADGDGNPHTKLVDFGIALASDTQVGSGALPIEGTPHFMAPEQAEGRQYVTPAADVYALALTFWWAVTGQLPFDGETPAEILERQRVAPLPPFKPRLGVRPPKALEGLLRAALVKDPSERVADARIFLARLQAVSGGDWAPEIRLNAPGEGLAPATSMSTAGAPHAPRKGQHSTERALARRIPQTQVIGKTLADISLAPPVHRTLVEQQTMSELSKPAPARESLKLSDDYSNQPSLRADAPLVGRSQERARLMEFALGAANDKRGMILSLEGPAGLGKSKLANWLRTNAESRLGFRCSRGVFHQDAERGLRGIRESFESLLGTRGMAGERLQRSLESTLARIGLTDERDAHTLLHFLRPGSELAPDQSSSGVIDVLNDTMLRTIEAFGREEPVLLLLEDVHWAGPEAASWLRFCLSEFRHRDLRVLVVLTVQTDDVRSPLVESLLAEIGRADPAVAHRFKLNKLDDEHVRQLVSTILNAAPELAEALVKRADGNPMHTVQLARYLRDEQLLEWSVRGWKAKDGVEVARLLPPSLADTLALRITALEELPHAGPRIRALINRAAVIGSSVRIAVLERMLELEGNQELLASLDEDLELILDSDLLRLVEKRFADLLSFPSTLIRDVVLERLRGRRSTRKLHLLASKAKQEIMAEEVDKIAVELMEHHAAARDAAGELDFCLRAAATAERSHRPHEAMRLMERALRLYEANPTLAPDAGAQKRELLSRMAGLAMGFGQYDRAMDCFLRVIADPETPLAEQLSARLGEAELLWMRGDLEQSLNSAKALLREAEDSDEPEIVIRAWLALAKLYWHRGDIALAEEALAVVPSLLPSDEHPQRAEYLWILADVERSKGRLDDAYQLFKEALELYVQHDNARGIAKCEAKMAVIARMSGDLEVATSHYRRALDLYASLGARRGVAHQLNGLGDIARFRQDLDLASEQYRRAVDIFQAIGVPVDAAIALTNLGIVARESRKYDLSEDAFKRALKVSQRVGFSYLILGVKLNYALLLAESGEREAAEAMAAEALEMSAVVELVDPDFAAPMELLAKSLGNTELGEALDKRAKAMWAELNRRPDSLKNFGPSQK